MNFSIIPKWVWVVLFLAVLGGVAGSGIYAVHSYNKMATSLSTETGEKNNALEANKSLQAEVDRLKQDVLDKQKVNESIAAEQDEKKQELDALSFEFDRVAAERDKARSLALDLVGKVNACNSDEALSTVPTAPDIGLDYAWKTYCTTNPTHDVCKVYK